MNRFIWISLSLAGIFASIVLVFPACDSADRPAAPGVTFNSQPGPTFTPTPCSGVFGDTTIQSTVSVNSGNVEANKYSFSGGNVYQLGLYTSGAGQFRAAIYADGGSAPSTLIAQSAAVSTVASPGWNYAPLTVTLPSGNYWLAFQTDTNVSTYYTANGTSLPYITQSFGSFPASYAGYTACACSVITMVADFCP